MNGPPGMPIQSLPAGWLKQITLTKERVNILEKQLADLTKRVKELESARIVGPIESMVQKAARKADVALNDDIERSLMAPPVKRGPGRPRKVPQA